VENRFQSSPFKCNLQRYIVALDTDSDDDDDMPPVDAAFMASPLPSLKKPKFLYDDDDDSDAEGGAAAAVAVGGGESSGQKRSAEDADL
jgi:hypothetical protein